MWSGDSLFKLLSIVLIPPEEGAILVKVLSPALVYLSLFKRESRGTSLVVQWLRIYLSMLGTWLRSLL